jgi:hypothetical protein
MTASTLLHRYSFDGGVLTQWPEETYAEITAYSEST